jgi:excisionase family DNA binding protein
MNMEPLLLEVRILTAKQVAEYLQLSKSKVYYMISRKQLPHFRVGKNVRVRMSDLFKWLDQMIEPTASIFGSGK